MISTDPGALIPIGTVAMGGTEIETVNARELHAFLGVGRDFTTWIKERVAAYGFSQDIDFTIIEAAPQNGGAGSRGLRTEFFITLDMAKELAMVERNEKGREARRYFIACERRAKEARAALATPRNLPEALRLAADLAERVERQQAVIHALEPKAEALDRIAEADGSLCITDAAKVLQVPPKDLFAFLRGQGWLYRRDRDGSDIGYQDKVNAGLLTHKVVPVQAADGREWARQQVRVTPAGLSRLAQVVSTSAIVAA